MFEELRLLGSTEQSIVLQTHRGRNLENLIELPPGEREITKYRRLLEKHRLQWRERKPPTGIYNCVGHVWASRRTSVIRDIDRQVQMIYDDDGYRIVDPAVERILPGDLVTYWENIKPHKGFWHVGMVFELREGTGLGTSIPWILSKWDSMSGEVLHHYMHTPFQDDVRWEDQHKYKLELEFWTDRP